MKYYLIFITTDNTGKDSPAVYPYDDLDSAVTAFHKQLGGWRGKGGTAHIVAMVIDAEGGSYRSEIWSAEE